MSQDLELSSLALRFLTESEFARVLKCTEHRHQVVEWPGAGMTFVYCARGVNTEINGRAQWCPVIYRAGALGGDVRQMHGGWVYLTPLHAAKEWREIQEAGRAYGWKG
jgi:hypothetical protein